MAHCHPASQLPINGLLVIPDDKPDICLVIRASSTPCITRTFTISKKVICSGYIAVEIEYTTGEDSPGQPLCVMMFRIPFVHFVEHKKAAPNLEASIAITLEFQAFDILDRRTIAGFIIIKVAVIKLEHKKVLLQPHTCLPENITYCGESNSQGDPPPAGFAGSVLPAKGRILPAKTGWRGHQAER